MFCGVSVMAVPSHDKRYDVKLEESSGGSWFGGQTKTTKSHAELQDERYVSYMMSIDLVLHDWEAKKIGNHEALANADFYMKKITGIGKVDAARARFLLLQKGLGDRRRMDLQLEYQELKKACGLKPPEFRSGFNTNHHGDSHGPVGRKKQLPCC